MAEFPEPGATAAAKADADREVKPRRIGRIEGLVDAVVDLAGDAAAMVTGTSLIVDGGWTAE